MTLVELLVVLGIIGLILAISVPGLTGYAKRLRVKTAARQVLGLLSLARSLAISSHEDHAVIIDIERGELHVVNAVSGQPLEQVVRLPNSVALEMQTGGQPSQESQVVFHPTGSLAGRTVALILADHEDRHTITVSGVTGSISLQ